MAPHRLFIAAFFSLCLGHAAWAGGQVVTVFAAASLKNALDELVPRFEHDTGHRVHVSLAGSSALARQIQHGAPADVFISANAAWMDALAEAGLLEPHSRHILLGNSLVLVAPKGAGTPLAALGPHTRLLPMLGGGKLAMAMVNAVPAGIYGKAALQQFGQWQELAPHVAQTDNVRSALALVASGQAPLGIVYASDAMAEPRVQVLAQFPATSHPAITYPIADLANRDSTAEDALIAYLRSAAAGAVFQRHGFSLPGDAQ